MPNRTASKPEQAHLKEEEREASATKRHGQTDLVSSSGRTAYLPQVERDLPAYSPKKLLRTA